MNTITKFDDLEKANAYVTKINEAHDIAIAKTGALSGQLKELGTQVKLSADTITNLNTDIKNLQAENALALETIADLGKKIDLQEEHGSDGLVVTVGKKNYKLTGDTFIYGGATKTAKELSMDADQLQKMVDNGSGVLTEVN